MPTVTIFSGLTASGRAVWLEVAVFLEDNGIPLAMVSNSLCGEPILFVVDQNRDGVLKQIICDLKKMEELP